MKEEEWEHEERNTVGGREVAVEAKKALKPMPQILGERSRGELIYKTNKSAIIKSIEIKQGTGEF